MRKMLLPYRLYARLVRHENDLPTHIPLLLKAGHHLAGESVPIREHPPILAIPHFLRLPGIMRRVAPTTTMEMVYQILGNAELNEVMQAVIKNNEVVYIHFDLMSYLRMLAKIAHSFAAASVGIENYDPFLLNLIFDRDKSIASYLIGRSDIQLAVPERLQHQIGWGSIRWGEQWLIGVRLRLFAAHPSAQPYTIIAGALTPAAASRYVPAVPDPS